MRFLNSKFKWGIFLLILSTAAFIFFAEYRFTYSFRSLIETQFIAPISCTELPSPSCPRHLCVTLEQSITAHNETNKIPIAIGMGITFKHKKLDNLTQLSSAKILFFDSFLPTFCKSLSDNKGLYLYSFYLAYDASDPHLSKCWTRTRFLIAFEDTISKHCEQDIIGKLVLMECAYSGNPAWSQNDAMVTAYLDGAQYFYRVNDDTNFQTPGWTDKFVQALMNSPLQNTGVVAPYHTGGATDIMTYDFVHRTHIDIFGFYYPRTFKQWYADTWISLVYLVNTTALQLRHGISQKMNDVRIVHTMSDGTRYKNQYIDPTNKFKRIKQDQNTYIRYLKYKNLTQAVIDRKKIIVLICGKNESSENWWGCFRNALTLPQYYPGWSMKILHSTPPSLWKTPFFMGVLRLIKSMKNVEIVFDEGYWTRAFSMAFDSNYEYVLFRSCSGRISDDDKKLVNNWMTSIKSHSNSLSHPPSLFKPPPTPTDLLTMTTTQPMPTGSLGNASGKPDHIASAINNSTKISYLFWSGGSTSLPVARTEVSKNASLNTPAIVRSIVSTTDIRAGNVRPILSIGDTLNGQRGKLMWRTLGFCPSVLARFLEGGFVLKALSNYVGRGGEIQAFLDDVFQPLVFSGVVHYKGFDCAGEADSRGKKLGEVRIVGRGFDEFEDELPVRNGTGQGVLCRELG